MLRVLEMRLSIISFLLIYGFKLTKTSFPGTIDDDGELSRLEQLSTNLNELVINDNFNAEPSFVFDDSTLYKINWLDRNDSQANNETAKGEQIVLTTENKEKYYCIIPIINKHDDSDLNKTKNDDLNPYQLLKPLFTKKMCSYRVENYWTYEICHGKYIRQFHEDPGLKGSVQEYYLGTFNMEDYNKYEKLYEEKRGHLSNKLPLISVEDLQLPYIEINMTDGTVCDVSNRKRFTRVLYVCIEDGKHELYSIKETSICEYEVIAFSSLLCLSPEFKLKTSVEHNINCYTMNSEQTNKIPKGFELANIEKEMKTPKSKIKRNLAETLLESKTIMIDTFANGKEVHINFISETDDYNDNSLWSLHSHIISKFLQGDYCLTGGSGWWKYEFCYGKTVNQFHEEKGDIKGRTVINLGKWDLQKHIEWLNKNPSKKPKPNKTPKQVWHYYSSGDYCESSNKPRTVEVKLKCRNDPANPESVAIYLMEPKTCEYILGVESTIVCDLLSTVNEFGIFQFTSEE